MSDFKTNTGSRPPASWNELLVQLGVQLTPQVASPLSGGNAGIFVKSSDGELYFDDGSNPAFPLTDAGKPAGGTTALLTGFSQAPGTVAATDTILEAFEKIVANAYAGLHGYNTTATSAGNLILTNASAYQQYFTGATTHTVTLPVVSTLILGWQYQIVNNSTGAITVNSSGGNLVTTVAASSSAVITCILLTGTDASSWKVLVAFPPLTSAHIFVGNAGNQATDVALSGEATIDNAGALTLDNDSVIQKLLTGYSASPGTVAATDSILESIEKLDGNIQYQMLAGGTGGFYDVLTFSPGSDTTTNSSFEDVGVATNQTVSIPISGEYLIALDAVVRGPTSNTYNYEVGVSIDDAAAVAIQSGSLTSIVDSYFHAVGFVKVTLSAGSHTFRPQWRRSGGAGTVRTDSFSWQMVIQANGAGINGLEVVEASSASDYTVTQVWSDTPGGNLAAVPNLSVTVNTLENERVNVKFTGTVLQTSTGPNIILGYQVDSDTAVVTNYIVLRPDGAGTETNTAAIDVMTAPLSAGQHTIKLMAATSGSPNPTLKGASNLTSCLLQVVRSKSNGLGAGTIVTEGTLSSSYVLTGSMADTGLVVTVNTIENERVDLTCFAALEQTGGASAFDTQFTFDIDGDVGAASPTWYDGLNISSTNRRVPVTMRWTTPPLSAGSHTIKVRAYAVTGAGQINSTDTGTGGISFLQATQYRGGLIPILNNSVSVVDKPDSLDFTSDFDVTNPSGLTAQIDLNCLDLSTALKVQPLADATYQLGDTAKNFFALYLDHGVTDGGTIYFNAGTTSFLKSAANGLTLDIAGFTAITVAGTIDGVDVSAHDHSTGTAQTRLAALDRRRFAPDKKAAADSGATDVTAEHIFLQAQDAVTITKVFYLPDAALTADDTNYATLTVYRRDADGTNQVVVASVSTTTGDSGNWVAFDGVDFGALTTSAIAAGQVLTWEIAKVSGGVIVPSGNIQVEYTVD